VYSVVQAQELVNTEMEAELAKPSGNAELEALSFQSLLQRIGANNSDPKLIAQLETIYRREAKPVVMLSRKQTMFAISQGAGTKEEAQKYADEILAAAETADMDSLPSIFYFATQRGDKLELVEKIYARLLEESEKPGQTALRQQMPHFQASLMQSLFSNKETAGRGIKMMAEKLAETYPKNLPAQSPVYGGRRGQRVVWQEQMQFPYANRYLDEYQLQQWRQTYERIKSLGMKKEFNKELHSQILKLPGDQSIYTHLVLACFSWWDDDKPEAVKSVMEMARDLKDDELYLLAASMLMEVKQPDSAKEVLSQMSEGAKGEVLIGKLFRLLSIAQQRKDIPAAKVLIAQLTAIRLGVNEQQTLLQIVQALNLEEEAKVLANKRTVSPGSRGQRFRIEDQMRKHVDAKSEKEALGIARAILAKDPLGIFRQQQRGNEDYVRVQALQALKTFKQLESYRAELEKQLEESPTSVRIVYLLAETWNADEKGKDKVLAYYRKMLELKPGDRQFQMKLAAMLMSRMRKRRQ